MYALRLPTLLLQGVALLALPVGATGQAFSNEAGGTGVLEVYGSGTFGGGVSCYDFDNDGWDDLTISSQQGDSIHFYKNVEGVFQKLPSLVNNTSEVKHVLWVDYDNDGDNDLFVSSYYGSNRLYRNDGNLNMIDVTQSIGLPTDSLPTFGATWADYNNDGHLDLYLTNRNESVNVNNLMYRNNGSGSFTDATVLAGVADSNKKAFGSIFLDWNDDGNNDLYVAHDAQFGNTLFQNMGNSTFSDASQAANANLSMEAHGIASGDYDNDGDLDIYLTNGLSSSRLLRNTNNSSFLEVASSSGVGFGQPAWGAEFVDTDNDGHLDLFVCGTQSGNFSSSHVLFRNLGNGNFAWANNSGFAGDTSQNFGSAVGDINNDGFPDLVVLPIGGQDRVRLWKNESNSNNWIKIKLVGTTSNRNAIGSKIEVKVGGQAYSRFTQCGTSYLGQRSGYEMVGIGASTMIDTLRVSWPSGMVETFTDVCPNRMLTITEGQTSQPVAPTLLSSGTLITCGDSVVISTSNNYSQYLWSNGEVGPLITVYNGGAYDVTITDLNGFCAISASTNLPLISNLEAIISVQQGLPCFGDTAGILEASGLGGVGTYQYQWSNGQSLAQVTGLTGGDYGVTITDSNGCKAKSQVFLAQNPPLTLNGWVNPVSCPGDSNGNIEVFAYGGQSPYSYSWLNNPNSSLLNNLPTGPLYLTVTDNAGCQRQDTLFMPEPDPVVAQPSLTLPSCFGDSNGIINMSATGGTGPFAYQWSLTSNAPTLQGLSAGSYELTITDANGCSVEDTVSMMNPDTISIVPSSVSTSCYNYADGMASVLASGGTGGFTYHWTLGSFGPQFSGLFAGTYEVVVTDANGCTKLDSVEVSQPDQIIINFVVDPISCHGGNDGSVTGLATGGQGTFDYLWSVNGDTAATISNLQTGLVSVTVTDPNYCSEVRSIHIDEPDPLAVSSWSDSVACFGDPSGNIGTGVTGGTSPYTVSWNNGAYTGDPLFNVPAGTYNYEITDAHGCQFSGFWNIASQPQLTLTGTLVRPDTWNDNGVATVFPGGGTPPYQLLWDDPLGQVGDTAYNLNTGSYLVILIDANGCSKHFSVNVPFVSSTGPDLSVNFNWRAFPNPANAQLWFEVTTENSQNTRIQMVDALGRIVFDEPLSLSPGTQTVLKDVAVYPRGWYLVRVGSPDSVGDWQKVILR